MDKVPSRANDASRRLPEDTGGVPTPVTPFKAIVCVVDDNADSLHIIRTALEHVGLLVLTARSAEAAVAIGERVLPDILVTDLSMPGKDGYWVVRRLREIWAQAGRRVPAIAITAYRETHPLEKARRAGFQEYMEKPLDPFRLQAVLGRVIASHRSPSDRETA